MTVSYNLDMSTSTHGSYLRILFRWRGSVWKSVLNELVVWTLLYYLVFAFYRFALSEDDQKAFESIAKHINDRMDLLPLHFMLGFFVTIVIDRWKQIFANIGFVDSAAYFIATYIRGTELEVRIARRNCARYLCLTQVLVLRDISIQVRKRFPNVDSLIDSGLLQPHERALMDNVRNGFTKYWMPIHWIFAICYDLRKSGNIEADVLLNSLLQEIKLFREKLQALCNYDWVPVPLAYPQVVFLAVRIYFLLCLFCRQYRWHENAESQNQVDRILPIMTMLQFFFIMGWLKVAEALLNPLGEDDDDYECNYIIDRNMATAMTMVDECFDEKPAQMPDNCGDEGELAKYSETSAQQPQHPLVGSATMSHLGTEREHVRMVDRRRQSTAAMPNGQMGLGEGGVPRRHSNLILRRMSSLSLNKLRQSLPIRHREGIKANGKIGDAKPNLFAKGWSLDLDGQSIDKMENGGGIDGTKGLPTIATAPELRRQHSIPTSPSLEEVRPHHLEPVKEDDDILEEPMEFSRCKGKTDPPEGGGK